MMNTRSGTGATSNVGADVLGIDINLINRMMVTTPIAARTGIDMHGAIGRGTT